MDRVRLLADTRLMYFVGTRTDMVCGPNSILSAQSCPSVDAIARARAPESYGFRTT